MTSEQREYIKWRLEEEQETESFTDTLNRVMTPKKNTMLINVKKQIEETVEVKLPLFIQTSEDAYLGLLPNNKIVTVYDFQSAPLICVNNQPLGFEDAVSRAIGGKEVSEEFFYETLSQVSNRIKELAQTEVAA